MSKIALVEAFLNEYGWVDGSIIRKLTNTTCARDYIYKINKAGRVRTIPKVVTPRYTKWLRVSRVEK